MARNNKGFGLVQVMVAGVMLAIIAGAILSSILLTKRSTQHSKQRAVALLYSTELVELFAAMNSTSLSAFVGTTNKLCDEINKLDRAASTPATDVYVGNRSQPLAELSEEQKGNKSPAFRFNRSFRVERIGLISFETIPPTGTYTAPCGSTIASLIPGMNKTQDGFLVTVTVSWGEMVQKQMQERSVSLSTLVLKP